MHGFFQCRDRLLVFWHEELPAERDRAFLIVYRALFIEYGALLIDYRAIFDEIHGNFQCRDRLLAFLQEELPAEELREEVVDFMLGAKPDQRCVRVKAEVCLCIPLLSFFLLFSRK